MGYAALVFGIISIVSGFFLSILAGIITGFIGLVLGIIATLNAGKTPDRFARPGLVLSIIALALCCIFPWLF